MIDWPIVAASLVGGGLAGYVVTYLRIKFAKKPTDVEKLHNELAKIVNQEQIDSDQRMRRMRMMRNGRKTVRTDSGPNAKVMRLRIRPTARRFRNQ